MEGKISEMLTRMGFEEAHTEGGLRKFKAEIYGRTITCFANDETGLFRMMPPEPKCVLTDDPRSKADHEAYMKAEEARMEWCLALLA